MPHWSSGHTGPWIQFPAWTKCYWIASSNRRARIESGRGSTRLHLESSNWQFYNSSANGPPTTTTGDKLFTWFWRHFVWNRHTRVARSVHSWWISVRDMTHIRGSQRPPSFARYQWTWCATATGPQWLKSVARLPRTLFKHIYREIFPAAMATCVEL